VIEPVPTTALDTFFGISILFFIYVGLSVTITVGLLSILGSSAVPSVLIFLIVAALLFAPFWSLFKSHYPELPDN